MYYVYILKSLKNGEVYIDYTKNVVSRARHHNAGLSYHTKKYKPWKLVYLEAYASEQNAKETKTIQ